MKRLLVLALILVTAPAIAFANVPADYKTKGTLITEWSCDSGKTTVSVLYMDEGRVIEVLPSTGDVLVYFKSRQYVKSAGANEFKQITNEERDEFLQTKAPAAYNFENNNETDCKITK